MTRSSTRALLLSLAFLSFTGSNAQINNAVPAAGAAYPQSYWSNGVDAALFSSAYIRNASGDDELATIRFSYVVNIGINYNYDFSSHLGLFTGVNLKNIGFIDKVQDSTIKRRVYTLGVPLGIKIGNVSGQNYVFFGGGLDVPFNYREKGFVRRGDKEKFNEWFSDRTPHLMPYVFIGYTPVPDLFTIKAQYYPGNFMNESYVEEHNGPGKGLQVYDGYKANLFYISLGFDINYKKGQTSGDRISTP